MGFDYYINHRNVYSVATAYPTNSVYDLALVPNTKLSFKFLTCKA